MSCCGEQTKVEAVKNIATGIANSFRGINREEQIRRLDICETCDQITYLRRKEIVEFMRTNVVEIVRKIEDLSDVGHLPKNDKAAKTSPFCRRCKCNLKAKASVAYANCCLGKWQPVDIPT